MINKLIIEDSTMREKTLEDIIKNLNTILNNNIFKQSLSDARNNWLDISADKVINNVTEYFKSIEIIPV